MAKHLQGHAAVQVKFAVRAASQKSAAEIVGMSLNQFRNYCSETGNLEDIAELDKYPPGTVLVRADRGGTIKGETGWWVAEDLPD